MSSMQGVKIDIKLPRRSLLVQFTCNVCGERTKRLVNRLAYERGLIYVQVLIYFPFYCYQPIMVEFM
jgi:protein import protein ZIM17